MVVKKQIVIKNFIIKFFVNSWCFTVIYSYGCSRFGLVWFLSKKNNQTNFFKKNWNRTETGSNRPVSVWFFRAKTGSNRFGSFFRFGLVFSCLARFFSVWVRFGFSGSRLKKPKPNQTGRFIQNFNRFFSRFGFFSYFFLVFSV
jgi:hypothetical protein